MNKMWKAKQYSELLAQMLMMSCDPQIVKSRILEYARDRERGIAGLAARAAMPKSVFWRWLRTPSARLSLGGFVKLAAAEGWSLAGLMTGDLSNRELPQRVEIQRGRRERRHLDKSGIQRRLEEALDKPVALTRIAKDLDISPRSLYMLHPDLCHEICRKFQTERSLQVRIRHNGIVDQVTETLLALKSGGKTLTLRNARNLTGETWYSSDLRSTLFSILRSELGGGSLKIAPRRAMTAQFISLVENAKERLHAASR